MLTLTVHGMHCQNCSRSVKEALEKAGATDVVVDLENKCVKFSGSLSKEQAKEIIDDTGFDAIL